MTNQLQTTSDTMAPPYAPLAMPKQVLTPENGAISTLIARLAVLKHSFRRIG